MNQRKYFNREDLQRRLNNATEKLGKPGGFLLTRNDDKTDAWADYSGFAVTTMEQGADIAAALDWLRGACAADARALRKEQEKANRRYNGVSYPCAISEVNGLKTVLFARYSLGD